MRFGVIVVAVIGMGRTAAAAPEPTWWAIPAPHQVRARVVVEAELTHRHEWSPTTIAPDVTVGLTPRWGAMVRTSRAAEGRIGAGNGFCVRAAVETINEPRPPCEGGVAGLGITALWRLVPSRLVARIGLEAREWSTSKVAGELGLATTWRRGRFWTLAGPSLQIALSNDRDDNRHRLCVPAYAGVALGAGELHLHTGVQAATRTIAGTYTIPLGIGGSIVLRGVRVGAEISYDKALGKLNARAWRSATAYVETEL